MSIDIADQAFAIEETSKYVCDLDPHILKKAMTSLLGHPDPEVRKAVSQEMAKASRERELGRSEVAVRDRGGREAG